MDMTTANMVNLIVNVTTKLLNVTREDIEKPQTSGEDVTQARAIIAKICHSYNLPVSAVRRALNRDENLVVYYMMHQVNEETLYDVKVQVTFYLKELEEPDADRKLEDIIEQDKQDQNNNQ